MGGAYVPPPDLDLRVIVESANGQTTLRYVLHSPNGAADHHYESAGEVTLVGTPDQERTRLMRRIEQLSAAEADEKLRAFGERLYREVLSPQLRHAYGRFRETVRSLQITSDEPWVPWELVRPFEDAVQPPIDDDYWAARFDLARWLAGSNAPAGRLDVHRLTCAAIENSTGYPPLPGASAERRSMADLATRHGVIDASPPIADRSTIAALLSDSSIQLWHFACHGDVDPDSPDESLLVLANGQTWQAEDLHGPLQAAIAQARPLVFLNACRVAQQGWSLTRLGGWVDAWVRRCRCGAFLGPQWSVTDAAAVDFAGAFYGGIERGQAVAAAVRAARELVRTKYPGDPTWLAYSLYAHPQAYVRFSPPDGSLGPSLPT